MRAMDEATFCTASTWSAAIFAMASAAAAISRLGSSGAAMGGRRRAGGSCAELRDGRSGEKNEKRRGLPGMDVQISDFRFQISDCRFPLLLLPTGLCGPN